MRGVDSFGQIGSIKVISTSGGWHPPEVWARLATKKILEVGDELPGPLRDQAHAFRKQIEAALVEYIGAAQEDVKNHLLRKMGS